MAVNITADQPEESKNEMKFYKKETAQNGASSIKFTKQPLSYEVQTHHKMITLSVCDI